MKKDHRTGFLTSIGQFGLIAFATARAADPRTEDVFKRHESRVAQVKVLERSSNAQASKTLDTAKKK